MAVQYLLGWRLVLLAFTLCCSAAFFGMERDVRTLCHKVVCPKDTECRVQLPCVWHGCQTVPVCAAVPPTLDAECPANCLAVVTSPGTSHMTVAGENTLLPGDAMAAITCDDMEDCPLGSFCMMGVCCYD